MNKIQKEAAGRAWLRFIKSLGLREANMSSAEKQTYFAGFAAALGVVRRAERGERFK